MLQLQQVVEKNTKNTGNNRRQYSSLLSDFLECYCGEKIAGNVRKSVNKKIYRCSSRHNYWKGKDVKSCENTRGMNMDMTDDFVVSQVKSVMTNSSILKERFKQDVMSKKDIDSSQIEVEKKMREKTIKSVDKQIELTVQSISTNEVNHMLKKTDDAIYKQIKKTLDEEKGSLEDKKSTLVAEIYELDNKKEWIDWITKYGDDISKRFEKPTTELLEGMIDTIVVSPTFAFNRDEVEKQVGHKIVVHFKQPIVNDSVVYEDDE